MRLTLTDFRCYTKETITLPESGVTLISGDSGKGKSTILNAILFVLYGDLMKPYAYGTTKCGVTLESEKYKIRVTRTCNPNRLTLCFTEGTEANKIFEDEVAQNFINKTFGMTSTEFQISSYFHQEKPGSILTLPPREQLTFIEKVSGLTNDYEEDKSVIKERINFLESQNQKVKSEISVYDNLMRKFDTVTENEKYELPKFFEDTNTSTNKKIASVQADLKNNRNSLTKLRELESSQKNIENTRLKLQSELDNFESLRSALGEVLSEEEIEKIRAEAEKLRSDVSSINRLKEALKLEVELEKLKKDHIDSINKQIEECKLKILPLDELTKIQSIVQNYEELSQKSRDQKRLLQERADKEVKAKEEVENIRSTIVTIFKIVNKTSLKSISTNTTLSNFIKKKIEETSTSITKSEETISTSKRVCLKCPKCESSLILENDILTEFVTIKPKGKAVVNISAIQDKLIELQSLRSTLQELYENLNKNIEILNSFSTGSPDKEIIECISLKEFQDFTLKISQHNSAESDLKKLEVQLKSNPSSINRIKQEIKEKRFGVPKGLEADKDTKAIEAKIKELDIKHDREWTKRGDYSKYSREISSRQKNLDTHKKKLLPSSENIQKLSVVELEEKIVKSEKELSQLNSDLQNNLILLAKSKNYQEFLTTKEALEKLKDKEDAILSSLQGIYALDKASKAAHITTLSHKLVEINKRAKIYIDQMFRNNGSIAVQLKVKTHNKSGDVAANLSIAVKINRKGNPDVDVSTISAGEKQRINLAFLLGINDLFSSNILLLDECLNNLHREIQYETIELLKEMCPEKQIIVVSHDTVEGACDNIIEL